LLDSQAALSRGILISRMTPKQRAAEAAMRFIKSNMVVGLGTGSTTDFFLQALGGAIRSGSLSGIIGIPTSRQSERRAQHLGIPLGSFAQAPKIDVAVDGADEVGPGLNLIKGLGGALLREKIVAQNSATLVIIADASKRVEILGSKGPLPVEVAQFGFETQEEFLRSLGCQPVLRKSADGTTFVTDNGNVIYDCFFPRIDDPAALETSLKRRAGVVECGLFVGIAKLALIADESGVQELTK
jgi:ribose 5-phosphate isomerase A